jgi:hypothetical protein
MQRQAITLVCQPLKESPIIEIFLISAMGYSRSDNIWNKQLDFDVLVIYS